MKKTLFIMLAILFLCPIMSNASTNKELFYKSEKISNQNEPYFEENGDIYVQVRLVAEALGMKVDWNSPENSVMLGSEEYTVPKYDGEMPLSCTGGDVGLCLDGQKIEGVKGYNLNGSTYFPLSALEKLLGLKTKISGGLVEFSEFKDYTLINTLSDEEYQSNFFHNLTSGSSMDNHDHKYELAYKLYEENKNDLRFLTNFFFNEWRFDTGIFEFWIENDEVKARAVTNTGYGASLDEWFINDAEENFNGNTDQSVTEFIHSEKDAYDALKRVLSGPVIASVSYSSYEPYLEVTTSARAFYSKIPEVTLRYSYPPREREFEQLNDGWVFIDGMGDEIPKSDVTDEVRKMYDIPSTYTVHN